MSPCLIFSIFRAGRGGEINPKAIGYATVVGQIKMYCSKHVTCFLFAPPSKQLLHPQAPRRFRVFFLGFQHLSATNHIGSLSRFPSFCFCSDCRVSQQSAGVMKTHKLWEKKTKSSYLKPKRIITTHTYTFIIDKPMCVCVCAYVSVCAYIR